MIPLAMQLAVVFLAGCCLGSLVNWAIYTFAWQPRPISPWSRLPSEAAVRAWSHRVPVVGWFGMRRESHLHGRGFWVRPLVIEFALGAALASLYWWEVMRFGLVQGQTAVPVVPVKWVVGAQFVSHALLLCWMLAASFIDIDERIVPDEITVSGTLLGLMLATIVPMSLLPNVTEQPLDVLPVVAEPLANQNGAPAFGPNGGFLWVEPVTPVLQPQPANPLVEWPPAWLRPRHWQSLVVGLGCYWLWCFALVPRIWRGRRGIWAGVWLILRRVGRELLRPPLAWLLVGGTVAIPACWVKGSGHWIGLETALLGLVGSGGIVWAVRLIGTMALRREAMGFGDVTLMMMAGTFLGWQACIMAFFLAPFAGLVFGLAQLVLRRDDQLPYVPYLCVASAAVVVAWAAIWSWAQPMFEVGFLVPAVLAVCMLLLGMLLVLWRIVKTILFGRKA